MKCKICRCENSMSIVPGSVKEIFEDDFRDYSILATFECRGMNLVKYLPGYFIVSSNLSKTLFQNADLSNNWSEYDEVGKDCLYTNNLIGIMTKSEKKH
ncbi:hypothetical protein A3Q56_02174 [Intoshia linei]|uniref:Uncharacterized protein n=1 Tax=Intoshia linei TaxID=1819745 RepID=A0A177B747_9BILA|nr:hypothetical protein A3Q56_02174 [Intoshia linei]